MRKLLLLYLYSRQAIDFLSKKNSRQAIEYE